MSVQIAIETYFEQFNVLPLEQNQQTLFAWMNQQGHAIEWEEFKAQWQSMTICADCGHCVGYIPGCDNCNPF